MHERLAAHERDPHRAEIADFFDPKLEVFQLRMWPRVVVFGAIRAVEVAAIREVDAALKRLPVVEPLRRFEQIKAGKFPTDFIEHIHGAPRAATLRGFVLGVMQHYALEPRKVATGASWAARRSGT